MEHPSIVNLWSCIARMAVWRVQYWTRSPLMLGLSSSYLIHHIWSRPPGTAGRQRPAHSGYMAYLSSALTVIIKNYLCRTMARKSSGIICGGYATWVEPKNRPFLTAQIEIWAHTPHLILQNVSWPCHSGMHIQSVIMSYTTCWMHWSSQVLSSSVSKGMTLLGEVASETARFADMFYKFFDALNVCNFDSGKRERKSFKDPYRSSKDFRLKVK